MHQDQRIGLALAVLLVGAAGALFFRNDVSPGNSSPRLKSGAVLDAQISEKSLAPYFVNNDDAETDGNIAGKISDRTRNSGDDDRSHFSRDKSGPLENAVSANSRATNQHFDGDLAPIPFPDQMESELGGVSARDRQSRSFAEAERLHIVQKGETLSSIAARELGSSSRFQEVFDANRDQLNDANDVRVGMSLRIPAQRTSRTATGRDRDSRLGPPPLLPDDASQTETEGTTTAADPVNGKKRFEPAKRAPTGVKGLTPSAEAAPSSKGIKKLSQLPPKESGGKIAR